MKKPSWRRGLEKRGGFWRNARWYDLHLERRLPLAFPMFEEMVQALPPLEGGAHVCDLACATGNTTFTLLTAYPDVSLTLLDEADDLLSVASEKIAEFEPHAQLLRADIPRDGDALPGGPFDIVVSGLALERLVGEDAAPAEAETRCELLYRSVFEALVPGGHLIVGDQVEALGLYRLMKAMERAGFVDVDCAWRQDDFFVIGGRVPE
jgi:trans-aconitate methyltransferase